MAEAKDPDDTAKLPDCSEASEDLPQLQATPAHMLDTLLDKCWRDEDLQWTEEEYHSIRKRIASKKPLLDEAETYKILLVGAIKAGKSSVINTIFSALRNVIEQIAFNAEEEESVTSKFRIYKLRTSIDEKAINVTLCDTMGFESKEGFHGPSMKDLEYIMDGHIMDGYKFIPDEGIKYNSDKLNRSPNPKDKVHAMIVVVDALTFKAMADEIMRHLRQATKLANDRDIRWAIVLTHPDEGSNIVAEDITKIFHSKFMQDTVAVAHERLGAIQSNIFAIQNYTEHTKTNVPMNILALHTMESILRLADNTLEAQKGELPCDLPPPEVIELLDTPWRNEEALDPENYDKLWTKISTLKPRGVDKIRICLMGPVHGGKTEFINSVRSEFFVRLVKSAITGCKQDRPTTNHFRCYQLKQDRDGALLKVEIADTMGLTHANTSGLHVEDIATTLDGKAVNKTAFNPAAPIECHGPPAALGDRMHTLAIVLSAKDFPNYSAAMLQKIKQAVDISQARQREIPTVALLTHIGEVCDHVRRDPTKVFRSQQVFAVMTDIKEKLQIPMVHILPVCNYSTDMELDQRKGILSLLALNHIVEIAQDYIQEVFDESPQGAKGWLSGFFG